MGKVVATALDPGPLQEVGQDLAAVFGAGAQIAQGIEFAGEGLHGLGPHLGGVFLAFEDGLAGVPRPPDVLGLVRGTMWEPVYREYVT